MSRKTKKDMILYIFDKYHLKEASIEEIDLINDKLTIYLGRGGKTSRGYIADVLKDDGKCVTYEPSYGRLEGEYNDVFKNILKFKTVDQAKETIRNLDSLYRMYKKHGDDKGIELCEWHALKGWQMSQAISMKKSVDIYIRQEKRQISEYFLKWYNNHDLSFTETPGQ
ncbi:MAG: hypothetical protein PHP06_04745 [Clostridia bacterium]|nr:hypothetical protein [Clostridia bacterium]